MPVTRKTEHVSRRLDRALTAAVTYTDVGASLRTMPAGYRHVRVVRELGTGCFDRAVDGLLHWDMHRGAGLRVEASSPDVVLGAVVLSGIGVGPVRVWAPCRVVEVVDEPARQGFAYGTLPGHPVSGEEAFVLVRGDDDVVRLEVTAFSRPATLAARAGGPLGPLVQKLVTRRYARALTP